MAATANPERVAVVPPSSHHYARFVDQIFGGVKCATEWPVSEGSFKDTYPLLRVAISARSTLADFNEMPPYTVIMPFWISPQIDKYVGDMIYSTALTISALKHKEPEKGIPPLTERLIGVCPYWEGRSDHVARKKGSEEWLIGEAISAELNAKILANTDGDGIDEMVVLGLHSHEDITFLEKKGIKVLNVSMAPKYAQYLKSHMEEFGMERDNIEFVALDKGSLEQNLYLCHLMGLDPKAHMTVFDKTRKGENMVAGSKVLYGNPEGKDLIISDDVIDTYGSMDETVRSLKEKYQTRSITLMITHGVCSDPARENIIQALLDTKVVDRIIMSDSLPKPKFLFKSPELRDKFVTLPMAKKLGEIADELSKSTYEHMRSKNAKNRKYILNPHPKEEVWGTFKRIVGLDGASDD